MARRRTSPRWRGGEPPERELEPLDDDVVLRERLMLGLRLDEPLPLDGLERRRSTATRSTRLEAARAGRASRGRRDSRLTERGRFLGGGVTAELLA